MPDSPNHEPRQITPTGKMGGPSWDYRGVTIHSNERGTLFSMEHLPPGLSGRWSGVGSRGHLQEVVDAWLDTGRLPAPYVTPEQAGE
jgi:hypothetical protein